MAKLSFKMIRCNGRCSSDTSSFCSWVTTGTTYADDETIIFGS